MVERYVFVAEVIEIRRDFYPIAASMFLHPWQSRFSIRLPWVQHVHVVLRLTYLAQILNAIIVLIAVDVVYLLFRPATFTDCPDGMVQSNMNTSFVYLAVNIQVAFFITLCSSYRSAISAACQPASSSIVSVVLFHAK